MRRRTQHHGGINAVVCSGKTSGHVVARVAGYMEQDSKYAGLEGEQMVRSTDLRVGRVRQDAA